VEIQVLAAHPASSRAARRLVAQRCAEHSLSGEPVEVAALLTSELVTNAVIHGRSPVSLAVAVDPRVLRVEVGDDNSRLPQPQARDDDALDGRGLQILTTLADRWGVERRSLGKAVWFELDLPRTT
jgi:anti-sigma regulatory factor (Ser/Thr protein kinase)